MTYFILIAYIVIIFLGSLTGTKKVSTTPEGYFLANRNLRTVALFFTILATNFSAYYFLGFAGEGYRKGYPFYFVMAFGTAFACLSFYLVGTRAWRLGRQHGYITPAELVFGQTGSRPLALLFSLVMILFTFPYLALQIVGAGYLLENLTGGDIPYFAGCSLIAAFTVGYVLLGGMTSVARTDLKQGLLAIGLMGLSLLVIGHQLGGIGEANVKVFEQWPELFQREGGDGFYTSKKWFSWLIFWVFCIPMFPQIFMRFYIASDISHLKKSALLYGAIPLVISLWPVMLGIMGHLSFPGLEGREADQILPRMLVAHTPEWFGALVMTGALAALMSTLDSQLLALGTMSARDLFFVFSKKKNTFARQVNLGRISVGVFAFIGLAIAWQPFDTIFDMGKMAFSGLSVLFPAALTLLWCRRVRPAFLIASIVAGEALTLGFFYQWIGVEWAFGFEPFIVVLGVCFLIAAPAIRPHSEKY
ncbi:MAG TPA: sodium:solute symporter family protein [Bacteroidetes bacterium]|nr:sodium:solute symporter family protein [Bacteroidota bacterium]